MIIEQMLKDIPLPRMVKIRQKFSSEAIHDIESSLFNEIRKPEIQSRIKKGMRIAIAVGSRGMDEIQSIVRVTVDEIKRCGAQPFIIPSMGSHGGATAEGQKIVLAHLGVTEESAGCPILSSMEVISLGTMENGLPVLMDKNAYEADGIVVINRVKAHNAFSGPNESGLVKMITIGLGKQKGADSCHTLGFGHMAEFVVEMARIKLSKAKFLFGIATVENAYDKIKKISAILPENIIEEERQLLIEAKASMPKLLVHPLDVLVVDQLGKEFSGGGLDPYIIGRAGTPFVSVGPNPNKVVVLDLTYKSQGNACGTSLADISTRRLFNKINFDYTYANNLTSTVISGRIPMILESDRMAIQAAIKTCNVLDFKNVRMARIANTLHVDKLYISENMIQTIADNSDIEILSDPISFVFNETGNITDIGSQF